MLPQGSCDKVLPVPLHPVFVSSSYAVPVLLLHDLQEHTRTCVAVCSTLSARMYSFCS